MEIGFKLCSEERSARDLVLDAWRAEEAGFALVAASDHFHPWLEAQGEASAVWPVLGAITLETSRIDLGTFVSCPTMRQHPAIVAQAAATVGQLAPGRTFLGMGTGEWLNEHITTQTWPEPSRRREMLAEAIEIIRRLWRGEETSWRGRYLQVDRARLYSLPDELPPIFVAASGAASATLAAQMGDGMIATAPDPELVERYRADGGAGPVLGEMSVCVADSIEDAEQTVRTRWPLPGIAADSLTDLPTPRSFEEEARGADVSAIRRGIPMGPDPLRAIERARAYRDAGFSRLVVHQIGPDPTPFFLRLAKPLLAEFRSARGSIEEQPQGRPLEAFSEHLGQDATRAGEAVRVEPSEKFRVLDLR